MLNNNNLLRGGFSMRLHCRRLFENKDRAIRKAKDKFLEKICENCKNWKALKGKEDIGKCKRDKLNSFFFFSCSKFIER